VCLWPIHGVRYAEAGNYFKTTCIPGIEPYEQPGGERFLGYNLFNAGTLRSRKLQSERLTRENHEARNGR
jgi:hypothetical protein